MFSKNIGPLIFFYFENLANQSAITHFVSTRPGGFSSPPFHSLNLAFHVSDNAELVAANREILATELNIPLSNFVTAQQVHEANIAIVTEAMRGTGSTDFATALPATDSLITNIPNVCLMVLTADCVPLILFDPNKKVIGVVHAGWKGTVQLIAQKTVTVMQKQFGCSPVDIIAGIGPSIGSCCYEVGAEVIREIERNLPNRIEYILNKKGFFNLREANKNQLVQLGISEKNIEVAGICTRCHSDIFYSARKNGINTGRYGTGIMLRK